MRTPFLMAALTAGLLGPAAASAQVPATGTFTAKQACPATRSIRSGPSPGDTSVQPGRSYQLVGKNKPDATALQIVLNGSRLWVGIQCGETDTAASPSTSRAAYVLALSWEPAFCGGHSDKPECQGAASRSSARSLSLHGLWPQPRGRAYCNVGSALVQTDKTHAWDRLPEPEIGVATRQRLAAVMPGVESGLQRHEWIEHGTCSGMMADAYFSRAVTLAEQVNASSVPAAFAGNIGRPLSADAIRAAFDQAFGPGAGARVTVLCQGGGNERRVTELDIALAGDVAGPAQVADLIRAAAPVPPSCPGGMVIPPRP